MNNLNKEDIDLEGQVIAELFLKDESVMSAISELDVDDFFAKDYGRIFGSIKKRVTNGEKFDALVVANDCAPNEDRIKKVILNAIDICISTDNYKEHIKALKQNALNRRIVEVGRMISDYAEERHTTEELQNEMAKYMSIFDNRQCQKSLSWKESILELINTFGKENDYLETGISRLDEILKISKGDYIVIGARPSVGKTAFALQMAFKMAEKKNVVFFSLETSILKITQRIVANQLHIPFSDIKNGANKEQMCKIGDFTKTANMMNLSIVEASGMTVLDMQTEAIRRKADVIFIDYIGLISSNDEGKLSSYERMTQISKALHNMAQTRKIAIIALSQLNRDDRGVPTMNNLRDSGQIEQDADAVILLSRVFDAKGDDTGYRLFNLAKNKEGELGNMYFSFEGIYQRFNLHEGKPEI